MLAMLYRRLNTRTGFAAAGLLAGLMLTQADWSLAGSPDHRADDKPPTPINASQAKSDFLESELSLLLTDFGVSAQDIPIDFVEKVRRSVRLYQTRDRNDIERVLGPRHRDFELVGQQVAKAHLPPDLAFLTLVESHFRAGEMSPDNNAGLWQFTQDTARRCGLNVNEKVDERLDSLKSTQAACRYLLRLRHELGQECSLMLVLAAYNMGPGRLKLRTRQIEDLSKRRDFWYLYRTHVLPALTRNHLARLMAAILIGRDPQHFGFKIATPGRNETATSAISLR
jgi:membrane-bound lytic murein transglycosylase D